MMRLILGALAVLSSISVAYAEVFEVGGTKLDLPSPKGYCTLDPRDVRYAKIYEIFRKLQTGANNTLLAIDVPCDKRDLLAITPVIDTYGLWLKPNTPDPPLQMTRAQFVESLKKSMPLVDMDAITKRTVNDLKSLGVKANGSHAGVIGSDTNAIYMGVVLTGVTPDGHSKVMTGASAFTLLRHKFVTFNLYAPFADAQTMPGLLKVVKATLVDSLAKE